MVEPKTPDVTFTVPGDLHARADAAYAAYAEAAKVAADQTTAAHARDLSAARVQLAAVYRELAIVFRTSPLLYEALDRMAAQQLDDAIDDDRWAERLEASTFGGDVQ